MTGAEVLALAAAQGVRISRVLGDLHLEADHEPPAEALVALRDHKEAVVAVLSKTAELPMASALRRPCRDRCAGAYPNPQQAPRDPASGLCSEPSADASTSAPSKWVCSAASSKATLATTGPR
jgi:hypothetical protein